MEFVLGVIAGVVAILVGQGLLSLIAWLRIDDNRKQMRQRLCRHDWRPVPEEDPGSAVIVLRTYEEECSKCGAQR